MLDCIMNKGDKYTPELIGRNGEIKKGSRKYFYYASFVNQNILQYRIYDNENYDEKSNKVKILIKGAAYSSLGKKYYFFNIDPNQDFTKLYVIQEGIDNDESYNKMTKEELINQDFIIDAQYVNLI